MVHLLIGTQNELELEWEIGIKIIVYFICNNRNRNDVFTLSENRNRLLQETKITLIHFCIFYYNNCGSDYYYSKQQQQ